MDSSLRREKRNGGEVRPTPMKPTPGRDAEEGGRYFERRRIGGTENLIRFASTNRASGGHSPDRNADDRQAGTTGIRTEARGARSMNVAPSRRVKRNVARYFATAYPP